MSKELWILLRLDGIWFDESKLNWWHDIGYLQCVFECLQSSDLWLNFAYYKKTYGKRFYIMPSIDKLLAQSVSWKQGTYEIMTEQADSPTCRLALVFLPHRLQLRFLVQEPELGRYRETLIDRFIDFTRCLHGVFKGKALFGPRLGVEVHDLPYPKVRPPRFMNIWTSGNAVDFISLEYHKQAESGQPDDVQHILSAPMPSGTKRIEDDDLVIFRWVDDLTDEALLAQRCSLQEQWFATQLDLPIDSSYNIHGDYREAPLSLEEHDPLTLYDSMNEEGYKTIVLDPDGGHDKEQFNEMAEWICAHQLPDGTSLKYLHLVLPNRESALHIRQVAKTIGIAKVLYTDDKGNWWNPDVPGEWIDIPYER